MYKIFQRIKDSRAYGSFIGNVSLWGHDEVKAQRSARQYLDKLEQRYGVTIDLDADMNPDSLNDYARQKLAADSELSTGSHYQVGLDRLCEQLGIDHKDTKDALVKNGYAARDDTGNVTFDFEKIYRKVNNITADATLDKDPEHELRTDDRFKTPGEYGVNLDDICKVIGIKSDAKDILITKGYARQENGDIVLDYAKAYQDMNHMSTDYVLEAKVSELQKKISEKAHAKTRVGRLLQSAVRSIPIVGSIYKGFSAQSDLELVNYMSGIIKSSEAYKTNDPSMTPEQVKQLEETGTCDPLLPVMRDNPDRVIRKDRVYDLISDVRNLSRRRDAKGLLELMDKKVRVYEGDHDHTLKNEEWTKEGRWNYLKAMFGSEECARSVIQPIFLATSTLAGASVASNYGKNALTYGGAALGKAAVQYAAFGAVADETSYVAQGLKRSDSGIMRYVGKALDYTMPAFMAYMAIKNWGAIDHKALGIVNPWQQTTQSLLIGTRAATTAGIVNYMQRLEGASNADEAREYKKGARKLEALTKGLFLGSSVQNLCNIDYGCGDHDRLQQTNHQALPDDGGKAHPSLWTSIMGLLPFGHDGKEEKALMSDKPAHAGDKPLHGEFTWTKPFKDDAGDSGKGLDGLTGKLFEDGELYVKPNYHSLIDPQNGAAFSICKDDLDGNKDSIEGITVTLNPQIQKSLGTDEHYVRLLFDNNSNAQDSTIADSAHGHTSLFAKIDKDGSVQIKESDYKNLDFDKTPNFQIGIAGVSRATAPDVAIGLNIDYHQSQTVNLENIVNCGEAAPVLPNAANPAQQHAEQIYDPAVNPNNPKTDSSNPATAQNVPPAAENTANNTAPENTAATDYGLLKAENDSLRAENAALTHTNDQLTVSQRGGPVEVIPIFRALDGYPVKVSDDIRGIEGQLLDYVTIDKSETNAKVSIAGFGPETSPIYINEHDPNGLFMIVEEGNTARIHNVGYLMPDIHSDDNRTLQLVIKNGESYDVLNYNIQDAKIEPSIKEFKSFYGSDHQNIDVGRDKGWWDNTSRIDQIVFADKLTHDYQARGTPALTDPITENDIAIRAKENQQIVYEIPGFNASEGDKFSIYQRGEEQFLDKDFYWGNFNDPDRLWRYGPFNFTSRWALHGLSELNHDWAKDPNSIPGLVEAEKGRYGEDMLGKEINLSFLKGIKANPAYDIDTNGYDGLTPSFDLCKGGRAEVANTPDNWIFAKYQNFTEIPGIGKVLSDTDLAIITIGEMDKYIYGLITGTATGYALGNIFPLKSIGGGGSSETPPLSDNGGGNVISPERSGNQMTGPPHVLPKANPNVDGGSLTQIGGSGGQLTSVGR